MKKKTPVKLQKQLRKNLKYLEKFLKKTNNLANALNFSFSFSFPLCPWVAGRGAGPGWPFAYANEPVSTLGDWPGRLLAEASPEVAWAKFYAEGGRNGVGVGSLGYAVSARLLVYPELPAGASLGYGTRLGQPGLRPSPLGGSGPACAPALFSGPQRPRRSSVGGSDGVI